MTVLGANQTAIAVRLNAQDAAHLRRIAKTSQQTVSEIIRQLIRAKAAKAKS